MQSQRAMGWRREPSRPLWYKLSLEEVEDLLGAIHTTLGIQVDKKTFDAPLSDVSGQTEKEHFSLSKKFW